MSDADDLVLASFGVSNDDQTPPPLIPLLLPNFQPRDLLHPWGQSITSRGGAPPRYTTFTLFPIPQPRQLQDPQPGHHYSNPDYYCQVIAADCPSPPPLRGSSPRSTADSPTFKNKKWKTQMCRNGPNNCRFGSACYYAHSKEELQKSTLRELVQDHSDANDEYPYLAYPCMHQIIYGGCPYGESCKFLHDTRIPFKTGGQHQMRATRKSDDLLVDRLYHDLLNFRENPLVQSSLWRMRSGDGDSFDETCNFLANNVDGIHSIFKLPFLVPLGTEKLSTKQKMIIAWKMHQQSPFPELSSCHSHRDFTFSYSASPGKYLDGKLAMILQCRIFIIDDVGVIKEVPNHSHLSYLANSIRAYEVVFDVKGSNKCNHSLWFDPTFKSCAEAKEDTVNKVHTRPYVFMQPVNEEGHHQLLASTMKELIVHNGNFGPKYNDLREQFNSLRRFHDNLAWPMTKVLPESANTLKTIADHVNSPYVIDADDNVKPIWKSFLTNIANLHGDGEGETVTQEAQGRKRLAARCQRSVYFSSSSMPRLKGNENIADFLAEYYPSSNSEKQ